MEGNAAVAIERTSARPQAAGTERYHLPSNGADETVACVPGRTLRNG